MARNDKNYWWPSVKNAPGIKMSWRTLRKRFHCAARERYARYRDLQPAVFSLGQVGDGKLMVIGNPHYNAFCVALMVTVGAVVLIVKVRYAQR